MLFISKIDGNNVSVMDTIDCVEETYTKKKLIDIMSKHWIRIIGMNFYENEWHFNIYPIKSSLKPLISNGFSGHDCSRYYICPYCGQTINSYDLSSNKPKKNGSTEYCPHCKEEFSYIS